MNILTSFAPFIVFAVLLHFGFTEPALWAGAVVAALLIAYDRFFRQKSLKILEIGTVILFVALGLYTLVTHQQWTIPSVRLAVDTGLLLIIIASVALGSPFTLQYARESTPESVWAHPEFYAVNLRITLVWAAAFAAMVCADALMAFAPIDHRIGIAITVVALVIAFKQTAKVAKN